MHAKIERFQILVPILCFLCVFNLLKDAETQIAAPACTEIGAFEIIDGTCKNYYLCVDDGEMLNPVPLTCASSAIFDPTAGRCVSESIAMCLQPTTAAPTTIAPYVCNRYGRFAIDSTNCTMYYLCYWDGTDYTKMDNLTCPNTLIFNREREKCVPPWNYTCPEIPIG